MYAGQIYEEAKSWVSNCHINTLIEFLRNSDRYTPYRPISITKFYKSGDEKVIAAESWLSKTRPTSFYKKYNPFIYKKQHEQV